jgi:hypothetical protein
MGAHELHFGYDADVGSALGAAGDLDRRTQAGKTRPENEHVMF